MKHFAGTRRIAHGATRKKEKERKKGEGSETSSLADLMPPSDWIEMGLCYYKCTLQ